MSLFDKKRLAEWIAERVQSLGSTDAEMLLELFRLYFLRFRTRFALLGLLILVISGSTGAVALLVKDFVNEIFAEDSMLFVPLFFLAVAIFIVKGAASYGQGLLSARIANEIVADMRMRLFEHSLSQKMRFFSKHSSDDLLMRFNQGATGFSSILTSVLVDGVRDLATVIVLIGVMLSQDAILALSSLIVAPGIFVGVVALMRKIKGLAEAELANYSELNRRVREMVQGITVIKAFNLEPAANEAASAVIDGLRTRADRIAALQNAATPLLDTAGGIAVGIAILYAGLRTSTGGYDAGTFMAFLTALLLAADPARRLSQMRIHMKTSFIMMKMVFEVLNYHNPEDETKAGAGSPVPRTNGAAPRPPCIEFDDVAFAYLEESPVLDGFSLRIEPGETLAFVGPSGAGKSTVFKLLLKFYDPESGRILIDGIDLADIGAHEIRDIVAYVGQSNFIFNASIRENVALMDDTVPLERIRAACAEVGLDDYIMRLPEGYDTNVGELGSLISGGQAQRLNLARAIIKDAPVLLLDEVTASLDAENEDRIKRAVKQMSSKTVLVIAHRLSTVKEADRIALVCDGKIVDVGSHEELVARNQYYEQVVALQFA